MDRVDVQLLGGPLDHTTVLADPHAAEVTVPNFGRGELDTWRKGDDGRYRYAGSRPFARRN